MKIGMLWYDADGARTVEQRVARAVTYYREKYGQSPTLCLVHPGLSEAGLPQQVGEVELRALDTVLPHHFWIGIKPVSQSEVTS